MANTDFALTGDMAEFDDLPRTLRREREAREREKKEREARESRAAAKAAAKSPTESVDTEKRAPAFSAGPSLHVPRDVDLDERARDSDMTGYPAATVKRIEVPFFHMMGFYLKAVVAAIPALILLTAILWGMGQLIKIFFPWLLKAQIFIQFPN